jgi:hypothetical protein
MATLISTSDSWVAFDSGITSVSRRHLEETIINHAVKIELTLDWLITYQLTSGARRIAFTISSPDSDKLHQLLNDLNKHFPNFAGAYELGELVRQSSTKSTGRAVVFPLELDVSTSVLAEELIKNSAIDAIVAVGEELPPGAQIQINNYLRPTFSDGKLELFVERIADGQFAPIETESPHECCGGHENEEPISL